MAGRRNDLTGPGAEDGVQDEFVCYFVELLSRFWEAGV